MKTPVKKRTAPKEDELWTLRREEILRVAAVLFAQGGYSDTDTQLLADRLGVGKGTIYRYFKSKEELFLAAVDQVMRRLRDQIDASREGIDDPLAQIEAAVRAYLEFFADNPGSVELLIQERAQFRDRKKPTYFEHRENNVQRWRDLYRSMIGEGRIRDIPVERITEVFGQLMYGTIFTNYFTGRKISPDAQAQDILDIMYHGILSEKERRAP